MNITACIAVSRLLVLGSKPEPSASRTIRTTGSCNNNDMSAMPQMLMCNNNMQITSVNTVKHNQCSCAWHTNILWRMQGLIRYMCTFEAPRTATRTPWTCTVAASCSYQPLEQYHLATRRWHPHWYSPLFSHTSMAIYICCSVLDHCGSVLDLCGSILDLNSSALDQVGGVLNLCGNLLDLFDNALDQRRNAVHLRGSRYVR